jgi:muconate cycloisomerase
MPTVIVFSSQTDRGAEFSIIACPAQPLAPGDCALRIIAEDGEFPQWWCTDTQFFRTPAMFRISKIDAFAVVLPLTTPIKLATITIPHCDNLIVRITDDRGRVGWGEASSAPMMTGETSEGMVAAVRFMAPRLEGREIEDAAALPELLDPLMYGNHAAKSAIDMALLDLIGQHRQQPLYEILGGRKRDRAAMIWRISGAPDEIETARKRRDAGFVAFKVKVATNDPKTDLGRAEAARKAVGDGVRVSADANEGYSPADALVFAKGAGPAGLDFFEQPVRGHDIESMRACAAASAIPIAADEGLHELEDIERHHELGAAAGGSLKLIKLGGAFQVMAAASLMQRLGMRVNLAGKAADTSIGSAAIAHVALALPALDWDCNITNQYLVDDVAKDPVAVVDGHIVTPEGPGLGITVDEEKLARYRRG